MKGHEKVVELLNNLLTNELTAINQYFVHAKMCADWGYAALASRVRAESIDEMKHADEVISRILYLKGVPNLQRLGKVNVGETVPEQLKLDLELEKSAVAFLNEGIELSRSLADHGTFELLTAILRDEEGHVDWIETQLELIEQIGAPNYLAQQVRA
jgi:bacterioferritin